MSSHSRGTEKIPRTLVSHLEQVRQKWAYETLIRLSSCCLYRKSSTPRDGIRLQAHRGGTSLNGIGNELIRFVQVIFFCVTVGFVYSRRRSTVTDLGVDRYTSHLFFLMHFAHLITCIPHCMAQDEPPNVSVCALHSIFMSSMICA